MDIDEESGAQQEAVHHDHVLRSFTAYRYQHLAANNLRRQAFANLPFEHQELLPNQQRLLLDIDHCLVANAEFLEDVCASARQASLLQGADVSSDGPPSSSSGPAKRNPKPKVTEHEMEKLRSTLRQLHRDWSLEGKAERDVAYLPILEALQDRWPVSADEPRSSKSVLVPGCGLGRLPFEIAKLGFRTQGNEFSLFMLFTASYILNDTQRANEVEIHPFCHSLGNIWDVTGATRSIAIPDVLPSADLGKLDMSMAAGDFLEIYKEQKGEWDCIVTCFFIDTAHNIVEYLQTIASLLAPGG